VINDAKEPSNAHKNTFKEEILQEITENFLEKIPDMVNQNVQDVLRKFQDAKNKDHEKKQKQINEVIGALNKHQSETQNTTNREINELKIKTVNIKEEVTHDMENLKKRIKQNLKQSERPLQQTRTNEDKILELEDKIENKEKN
jgi:hypothetical protein